MATSTPTKSNRHYTPRKPLADKDEAAVAKIAEKYPKQKWAERYARKVLKFKNGLRATPAPVPPELDPAVAKSIRESFLGPDKPKEAKPAAAKKTAAKPAAKKTAAKPAAKKTAPVKDEAKVAEAEAVVEEVIPAA